MHIPENKIEWTHFHVPSFGERCIIIGKRGGVTGLICGNYRVLLEDGYVGWCRASDVYAIPNQ